MKRAGLLVAMAYVVCVLTPSVAIAFAAPDHAAHCLELNANGPTHVHQQTQPDAQSHHAQSNGHGNPADSDTVSDNSGTDTGSQVGQCCGLFCVSALAPDVAVFSTSLTVMQRIEASLPRILVGQSPDRIDRPPRSLVLI